MKDGKQEASNTRSEIEQPRHRKCPRKYDAGAEPHVFSDVKDYFKKLYYEACDLLSSELEGRFQPQYISPVLSMEQLLIKATNNKNFESEMKMVKESCFSKDIPFFELSKQLPLLHDMVKTATSCASKV